MKELEVLIIERACERLVLDFAFFSDHREFEALGALFTEQGTMTRPAGNRLVGRAAIVKSYQARLPGRITRHICTNIRVTVESAERARGFTYAVVYSPGGNPRFGEFVDEFLRTPEGWRIAPRIARFVIEK